jgi:hypothetical protein
MKKVVQRTRWNFLLLIAANLAVRHEKSGVSAFSPHPVTMRRLILVLPPTNRGQTSVSTTALSLSSDESGESDPDDPPEESRRAKIRRQVQNLAKTILTAPTPVVAVLSDATVNAVDMAVDDLVSRRRGTKTGQNGGLKRNADVDISALIEEAFLPMEESLQEMDEALKKGRGALKKAKVQALEALQMAQTASMAQALESAVEAVEEAEKIATRKVLADIYVSAVDSTAGLDISTLAYEDVDYGTSEMASPFLGEDQCLVPGEPVVRVEKAPENSRRIFAGIDIMASVDEVWNVLTDYSHLQDVVPNLVVNDVLKEYPASGEVAVDASQPEDIQCEQMSKQMKGSLLRQVGGAKVAGIQFSARTTLEVREWPQGLPDFAHFRDEVWEGKSRKERAKAATKIPLERYKFPRPFAVSALPTRDISMQSIPDDDGEFRMYQGVWRMQPLPGCSPPGSQAMRLTYAVEVSPRAYLPVQLVEGRIVRDLCTNLLAMRDVLNSRREETA